MYRLMVLYPPPHDPAAFRAYYEATHLKLVAEMPGLRASSHGFALEGIGDPSPYFCVWQGDFDDLAAMRAAMGSAQGKLVAADVANYATGGCILVHYAVQGAAGG